MSWGLLHPWCDPPPSTADPSSPDGLGDEQLAESDAFWLRRNGAYIMGPSNNDQNNTPLNVPGGGSLSSVALDVSSLNNAFSSYVSGQQSAYAQAVQWQTLEPSAIQGNWTLSPAISYSDSDEDRPVRKKKKVYKIKLNVTNDEIAKAITKHTKEKSKTIIHQADIMEAQITQEEQVLMQKQRMLANAKNRVGFYKAQKKRLSQSKEEFAKDIVQAITNIKQFENVQGVTLDGAGRIIITTTPLSILKPGWKKAKVAGVYQIRIDFSRSYIHEGIRVLNTTQRASNQYDSPTISGTHCCWGNIARDIERDFYSQNIEELVLDMLEYIDSVHEQHGYLGLNGDKNKGWEQFFADAQPQPEKFGWEAYDRSRQGNEHEPPVLGHPNGPMALEPNILSVPQDSIAVQAPEDQERDELRRYLETIREERDALVRRLEQLRTRPQSPYENELHFGLGELGLREESIDHFFRYLREGRDEINHLRIEQAGSHSFEIIVDRGAEENQIVVDERDLLAGARDMIRRRGNRYITLLHNGYIDIQQYTGIPSYGTDMLSIGPQTQHQRVAVPRQPIPVSQTIVPQYHLPDNDTNLYYGNSTSVPQIYDNLMASARVTAPSTSALTQENLQALIRMAQDQTAPVNTATGLEALQRAEGQAVLGLRNAVLDNQVNPVSGLQEPNEATEEAPEERRPRYGLIT